MSTSLRGRPIKAALILLVLTLCGFAMSTTAHAKHSDSERLVVRGDAIVGEADDCDASGCVLQTAGSFRGTLGKGDYSATVKLRFPDQFDNGEDGVCAPITGQMVLGRGTPDRLTLALAGDSCQDGSGPPPLASFTGLATWVVVKGTGKYAHARGTGTGSFVEDAQDRERMTLIGRIAR